MRFPAYILLAFLALMGLPASAFAALHAKLAGPSADAPWQLLAVTFPPTAGEVDIAVQDIRGGPQVVRRVPGNVGTTWLPLPLQAPAELPGPAAGQWPVRVSLRANNRLVEQTTVELTLSAQDLHHFPSHFLVASVSLDLPGFTCIQLPPEEILHAPALLFAACDMVYLTPEVQSQITEARALELLAMGARLAAPVSASSGPPGGWNGRNGGSLSHLVWESIPLSNGTALWLTAAPPLPRPSLLETGLNTLPNLAQRAAVPANVTVTLILVTPLAILLLLISRGLFHRRRAVLLASIFLLAGLSGTLILYLRGQSLPLQTLAQWQHAPSAETSAGTTAPGNVLLEERLLRLDALFPADLNLAPDPGSTLLPLAATRDAYWALHNLQIHLTPEPHLTGTLPPHAALYLESRSARTGPLLPAFPESPAERAQLWQTLRLPPQDAHWLIAGYVKPADDPAAPGILFSTWAADQPQPHPVSDPRNPATPSTLVWYNLRFQASHRYLLFFRKGIPTFLDFGPPTDQSPESSKHP